MSRPAGITANNRSRRLRSQGTIMRAALAVSALIAVALGAAAHAAPRVIQVQPTDNAASTPPEGFQSYHGYIYDLSENADRKDSDALVANLKHQLDIVDKAGFSPHVVKFFHTVPIVASETDCLEIGAGWACYGLVMPNRERHGTFNITVWDHEQQKWVNPDPVELAVDAGPGVIVVRPFMSTYNDEPVLLHEFLHVFHGRLMSQGYDNLGVKAFYAEAKSKNLFPKKSYTLFNHKEFFAVTASIFLAGKDTVHEPFTRAALKEKMPDYYKYLVGVFGFDPEKPNEAPVASAETVTPSADAPSLAP
jgi:hypothetical protein